MSRLIRLRRTGAGYIERYKIKFAHIRGKVCNLACTEGVIGSKNHYYGSRYNGNNLVDYHDSNDLCDDLRNRICAQSREYGDDRKRLRSEDQAVASAAGAFPQSQVGLAFCGCRAWTFPRISH